MLVSELIDILKTYKQDAEVVMKTEEGFMFAAEAIDGVFALTDYGNDFYPYDVMCVRAHEERAVCLFPDEEVEEENASKGFTQ